ncbi:MAG: class E sortase [Acidimicrobiia bacterium]
MVAGLFVALALLCTGALVVGSAGGSDASAAAAPLTRAAATRRVAPAVARPVTLPMADPAVAAAAWVAAHPPPPPPLPTPAPLPDPSAHRDLVEIGRIQIPKTGLDQPVREGVEQMVIDAGPAHWPGTASFGGWGNVVLAGHRTSHTEPFLRNAELAPGDEIVLSDDTGSYHYAVTGVEVVPNTAMWIVDQHPGRTLTIFTCHPIGSSAERLVVHAELRSRPRPGA